MTEQCAAFPSPLHLDLQNIPVTAREQILIYVPERMKAEMDYRVDVLKEYRSRSALVRHAVNDLFGNQNQPDVALGGNLPFSPHVGDQLIYNHKTYVLRSHPQKGAVWVCIAM